MFSDDFYLPIYLISPAEIFAGQIPALSINFINPENPPVQEITGEDGETRKIYDSAAVLSPQISKWYVALRNLVLIGLMVVLLYIGIRIVISSTASEKAKYKEHIKDWLVSVVLVVFMHYIMAFAITITGYITDMLEKNNETTRFALSEDTVSAVEKATETDIQPSEDGNYYYYTNLMGYARLMQQANLGYGQFSWNSIGYTIVFMALVIYTVMFLIIYLKRVIYMAFLTMIAPLVALTYPIDKISDGQAQAFNMWLKEYIYNLLLQPFHLLLYTMLVGSAMEMATNNMIYTLVALGFLIPAEKLLRRFFGFDQKAPEAGSIVGGVVGGSMAMNAINSIGRIGAVSKRGSGNDGDGKSDGKDNGKTRLAESNRRPDAENKVSMEELMDDDDEPPASGNVRLADTSDQNQNSGIIINGNSGQNNPPSNGQLPRGVHETGRTSSGIYLASNMRPPLEIDNSSSQGGSVETQTNTEPIRISGSESGTTQTVQLANQPKRKISGVQTGLKVGGAVLGTAGHYIAKGGSKVPRLLTKGAMAAGMGAMGVAAGIASGDLSNVAAYGAAAAGVGLKVGDGVSNVASNITTGTPNVARGIRREFEQRAFTKQQREVLENQRSDKEWRKSREVQQMYKDEFGTEKDENGVENWKKAMEMAQKEFRTYGVTNDKSTIKRIKAVGLGGKVTKQDVATARATASVQTEDELKALSDRLRKNGVSESKIKKMENDVRSDNVSGNFT